MTRRPALRLAVVALAATLLASCSSMFTDQKIGTAVSPSGGDLFQSYVAIGTSIGAGIQSGGISDSTQREAFTAQLAGVMGLTPGVDWNYPSFKAPGCPAPLSNALTGARVGGASAAACATRDAASARPFEHNVSIPSLRAAQVMDITNLQFPATDTLKLAQFIVGSHNPIDMVDMAGPTFVTLEVGANDVLGAATRGDTTLLTSAAGFGASMDAIAARLDPTSAKVAISNVPNVTSIPHFTKASILWCLKNGICPGVPATPPFNLASFTIDISCAPAAVNAASVGDTYFLTFPTLGAVVSVLSAGRLASINCATDQTLIAVAAAPAAPSVSAGPTINSVEYPVIAARVTAFNTKISALATAMGWALVDFAALLTGQAAAIPPIPSFSTPSALFGTLFSQDGIHPTKAGHRLIANAFITAINGKFSTSLVLIP